MTVQQLLASVSSGELTEWMAFDSIEPFGDPREDLRTGILAAAAVNHSMSPPKHAARPIDFMPFAKSNATAPLKLANPAEHGKLIARSLFGSLVKKKRHGTR